MFTQIRHALAKLNIEYEENVIVHKSIAPVYAKSLDACFFVTDLSRNNQGIVTDIEKVKLTLQKTFNLLLGNKTAVIIDVSDFMNGLDIAEVVQSIKDSMQEESSQTDQAV